MNNKLLDFLTYKNKASNYRTEIVAGITTFLTMMYIIVVNPEILAKAGMPYDGVLTATVLISSLSSILMGIFAKNPIALAPGMGLNAFFTYSVVMQDKIPWQTALGAVFWGGIIFMILSITNIRAMIIDALPKSLRHAMACGIGLFIADIGIQASGIIKSSAISFTTFANFNLISVLFIIGLILSIVFIVKGVKASLIIGIIVVSLLAIPIGRVISPSHDLIIQWHGIFSWPSFSTFFQMNLWQSLHYSLLPVLFTFAFTDLFDSISTFVGVSEAGDLLDDKGEPRNLKQSMAVDALSSVLAGLFGSSPATSYIESATGIEEGGRTGLTAIVVGLLFLPFMFLAPLTSMIPAIATAPALVIVGVFMMRPVLQIHWLRMEEAFPAFLIIILIPLFHNITMGVVWGILAWMLIKALTGQIHKIKPMLWIIGFLCLLLLFILT